MDETFQEQTKRLEDALRQVAAADVEGLVEARRLYGDSWKQEGGFSAFFNVKRKIDRLCQIVKGEPYHVTNTHDRGSFAVERYDIFKHMEVAVYEKDKEGALDAVRDLRRYLALCEAELIMRGVALPLQRDNKAVAVRRAMDFGRKIKVGRGPQVGEPRGFVADEEVVTG